MFHGSWLIYLKGRRKRLRAVAIPCEEPRSIRQRKRVGQLRFRGGRRAYVLCLLLFRPLVRALSTLHARIGRVLQGDATCRTRRFRVQLEPASELMFQFSVIIAFCYSE